MTTKSEQTNIFVREMLRTRTMAQETIARHGTEDAIFDDGNLAFLRQYCAASPTKRNELLRENDLIDRPGQDPGTRAVEKGNLIVYAAATGALTEDQMVLLNEWFEKGGHLE